MSAWPTCSMIWTTACKPTARPEKAKDILIGTPSSGISPNRCGPFRKRASQSSRWTRRSENWSGITRIQGESGSRRDSRRKSRSMTIRTSNWAKIEHRMVCHITENWRGRPLRSRATVVNLIGSTTTTTGLHIEAAVDDNKYPSGIEVTEEELAAIRIRQHSFHGEWNYTISPKQKN